MGGYGSGRPAERPGAEELRRFTVDYAAAALRQLRAAPVEPGKVAIRAGGAVSWSSRGRPTGNAGYTVAEGPRGPVLTFRYSLDGEPVTDDLALVERPSNLGRGAVLYIRCACGQLARVLYLGAWGRFRCRRCVRPVYQSSRESDRRVSDVLAGDLGRLADPPPGPGAGLGDLMSYSAAGLIVLWKAAERLSSPHQAAGRPWSPARRAAQERRRC